MEINLGSIQIPINAVTKTFAVLGKRGGGKTYTGGVMAEEFFRNNIPFIVFDPIDVWWGLRVDKNGKDRGLPVVVFGVEHADIPLTRDMGRQIAQAVVRDNVSCVISTFGLPKVAQRHLVAEFADEILNINNTPRHIFIEEAHEYVPQRVFGAMSKTFNAVSNLIVMGRNRGLGVTLLNQRAATVNKDVLTQIDTLIAVRSVGPQDRKALKEWVEAHAAEGNFEKFIKSLPSLPTGESWIWSPEFLGIFERIKIRRRNTFHPDREKLGAKFEIPRLDQVDIQGFIERFNESAKSPRQKQIKEKTETVQPKNVESHELIALRNEYESRLLAKDVEIRNLQAVIENVRRAIGATSSEISMASSTTASLLRDSVSLWLGKLKNSGAARMFKLLAENPHKQFTRNQIALAAGLSHKSGTFGTYLSKLRSNHLIVEQGGLFQINPDL